MPSMKKNENEPPAPSVSLIDVMRAREIGERRIITGSVSNLETLRIANNASKFHKCMSHSTQKAIDEEYRGIISCTQALRRAVEQNNWEVVESAVGDIILTLLESGNSNSNALFHVSPKKKQQRECFVRWGGVELLLRLFEKPFVAHSDARNYTNPDVGRKCEVWNETLVILREVCFAIPSLSEKVFGMPHIVFLFTMLSHQSVFDNTMNLLEEILAARDDTFQLSLIPDVYSLFDKFSARQLAHFCRVLSLLLFEPEDRLVMEGSAVLHSVELLHLRRNRMAKNFSGIVERNQSLIAEMPRFLSRLVQILRVVNFGPNLADLISHNIVTQMPITSDILTFFSSSLGISDWDHFSSLESIVAADQTRANMTLPPSKCSSTTTNISAKASQRRSVDTDASLTMSHTRNTTALSRATDDDDITQELLSSFSPNSGSTGSHRVMDLSSIINVMQVARSLGIADMTPLGEQLLDTQQRFAGSRHSAINDSWDGASHRWHGRSPSIGSSNFAKGLKDISPKRAKKELQFHAMLLSPHQIELIFVLCTLLSGRRKIEIQQQLAALGLETVLLRMFDRMSWTASGARSPSPGGGKHIHGPSCECDPESAFRVQFLRLVHNFYDRDFLGNSNKFAVLSAAEKIFVQSGKTDTASSPMDPVDCGLLDKTMIALTAQEPDSVYRFWLSACVENFLRGCGRMGQLLIARAGILSSTVKLVVQPPSPGITQVANTSLQTCFDLLGELVKCNQPVLEMLDASLSNEEFNRLLHVIMNNLVDSNVFVRSLLLSLEIIGCPSSSDGSSDTPPLTEFGYYLNSLSDPSTQPADRTQQQRQSTHPPHTGYLTSTWIQFEPVVLSQGAIDVFKRKPVHHSSPRTVKVTVGRSSPKAKSSHGMLSVGEKFLKDIRRATKHLLKFGESVSDSGMNVKENRADAMFDARSAMDEVDVLDAMTPRVDEYYTPPEQPVYNKLKQRNSGSHTLRVDSELLDSVIAFESSSSSSSTPLQHSSDGSSPLRSATTNRLLDPNRKDRHSPPKSPSSLTVPHSLLRVSLFLSQEKAHIVLRLMSVVSLRNVNHENICCLNTTLLILLIENRRESLGAFLQQVRSLADEELSSSSSSSSSSSAALPSKSLAEEEKSASEESSASEGRCCRLHCATCQAPPFPGPISGKSVYCLPVENELTSGGSADHTADTGADLVFRNFRLLLWYWQEYYLRRGRDRLSIEFSTHIPFRCWLQLVELLCADDGSPTALLQQSICLPQSPYARSVCGSATFSMPAHENVRNYN